MENVERISKIPMAISSAATETCQLWIVSTPETATRAMIAPAISVANTAARIRYGQSFSRVNS